MKCFLDWKSNFSIKNKYLIRRMKTSILLLFLGFYTLSANTVFSQGNSLSVNLADMSIKEAIREIEKNSEYVFVFSDNIEIETKKRVNINMKTKSIEKILANMLRDSNLSYQILDKQVVIYRDSKKESTPEARATSVAQQEKVSITGTITDSYGEPLIGVSISVKGTTEGVITNIEGNYSLQVTTGQTLVFSYIGYISQEIVVGNLRTINVKMEEDSQVIDEVVVVGYGTMKKSDLTGSVASVSSEKIGAYPTLGATQAMQGRVAGVMVTSLNGEPGAAAKIRVRGGTSINASSDPLYVIDGFAGGTAPPSEDIQSIEVLKDASATAIYGARGANGVILITTKRGNTGKPVIELNASYSVQEIGKKYDLLNGSQFATYVNEVYANDGSSHVAFPNPESYGKGTDWQDEIFRTGGLQNYQVSASGGTESLKYYTSLGYYSNKGTVINSQYERISGLNNLEIKANKYLRLGTKLYYVRTERDGVRTQETSSGASGAGVISAAVRFEPTQGIYNEDGSYTLSKVGDPHDNPVAVAKERKSNTVGDRFSGNAFAELTFLNDFKFYTTMGVEIYNERVGTYVPRTLVEGASSNGSASIDSKKNTMLLNENYLTWSKQFDKVHSVTAMGGYSYQSYRGEEWAAQNRDFVSDAFEYWNLGGGTNYRAGSSKLVRWKLASFYGRLNYSYRNKYIATFTGRYDGSSRLGANDKWAFFPSGALAWNIKEEAFMEDVSFISHLKVCGSYGSTGNTEIDAYSSLAKFSTSLTVLNGNVVSAVRPTSVANKNLKWEHTTQMDIGIDVGLLNGRINLTADYYNKKTEDLLYQVPLPSYTGYNNMYRNIGSIRNRGFEFSVSTVNFRGKFNWSTDFNISFNRNKILQLEGGDVIYSSIPGHLISSSNSQILREGKPVGSFFGWIYDGVYQENDDFSAEPKKKPGDVKYRDITGRDDNGNLTGIPDGIVDSDDRTIIGDPNPDFTFGFNNDFRYKNFDLNIFFQGSVGNDIVNYTRMELDAMMGKANATTDALSRWTPTNTNTNVPRASASHSYQMSTRWVEDGTYIRLKNIALGYNLPAKLLKSVSLSKCRIYFSAQNILTITDYSGYDPEVGFNNSNRNIGLDYGTYPNVKSYTLGVQIGF